MVDLRQSISAGVMTFRISGRSNSDGVEVMKRCGLVYAIAAVVDGPAGVCWWGRTGV